MRVISGFVAAAMLAVLAQPAFAVCVYHGSAKHCVDDRKYGYSTPATAPEATGPEKETVAEAPAASLKTIVMQSGSADDNAWVMTPGDGDGTMEPRLVDVAVPACELGASC